MQHGHLQPLSPPGSPYNPQYAMYYPQQQPPPQQQYHEVPELEDPRLRRKQPSPPGGLEEVPGRAPSRDPTPHIATDSVDGLSQTFDKAMRMPPADA